MATDYRSSQVRCSFPNTRVAAVGTRTFLSIARVWHLSPEEQQKLLDVGPDELELWTSGKASSLQRATLMRLSRILGIYAGLQVILGDRAAAWLRRPNAAPKFEGRSAMELMLHRDNGLEDVHSYVDAWFQGN